MDSRRASKPSLPSTILATAGNTRNHFGEILFMAFASLLCGVRSYVLMEEFCELKESWLRKWLTQVAK